MKSKKQKEKKNKTTKEIISEVRNEFKDEESKYQIIGNSGGDYIKTKLPKTFYEDITTGEMSLEYDFSIEKLTKLMDLYSLGIQYFLENNPTQAKAFQDRMGFILTNKDTLFNLKRQQAQEQREKEEKERREDSKRKSGEGSGICKTAFGTHRSHHHESRRRRKNFRFRFIQRDSGRSKEAV